MGGRPVSIVAPHRQARPEPRPALRPAASFSRRASERAETYLRLCRPRIAADGDPIHVPAVFPLKLPRRRRHGCAVLAPVSVAVDDSRLAVLKRCVQRRGLCLHLVQQGYGAHGVGPLEGEETDRKRRGCQGQRGIAHPRRRFRAGARLARTVSLTQFFHQPALDAVLLPGARVKPHPRPRGNAASSMAWPCYPLADAESEAGRARKQEEGDYRNELHGARGLSPPLRGSDATRRGGGRLRELPRGPRRPFSGDAPAEPAEVRTFSSDGVAPTRGRFRKSTKRDSTFRRGLR